jgi:crossover junction endodeoxyribonuclease RuvC
VAWHTPSEVKAAVSGSGRADKAQVASMVVRILRLSAPPRPVDATDALALAICHIWRGSAAARIDRAVAAAAPSRIPRSPNGGRAPAPTPRAGAPRPASRSTAAHPGPGRPQRTPGVAIPVPGARITPPGPTR